MSSLYSFLAIGLTQKETTFYSQPSYPCKHYSKEVSFVQISKPLIWKHLKKEIKCHIPQISQLVMTNLTACNTRESALDTYDTFQQFIFKLIQNLTFYATPMPCTQQSYNLESELFHSNIVIDPRQINSRQQNR
jgi:hypothetical protein